MCSGHHKVLEIIDNVQKMCEWLSHGEWCDVTLLCGGRSFNAHRAVLASVSNFLRRILLSCPSDETTTLIVLPDFDLEAMSSVLYYMYNGEVIVQKNKLGLFLDIIQAMQIYIDCQYLPIIRDMVEKKSSNFNTSCDLNGFRNIFTLGLENDKEQRLLNIRKGLEWQNVLQYSQNESDFQDSVVRRQNGSELRKSRLGNLKSPYQDRQRNSFLRDLFIETYPRNGNGNGLTEGVLAISNESYRTPASVLSSNANGEHLSNDGSLTRFTQNTALHNDPAIFHFNPQLRGMNNFSGTYGVNTIHSRNFTKLGVDTKTSAITNSNSAIELFNNHNPLFPLELNNKSLSPGTHSSIDFTQSILEAMKHNLSRDAVYSLPHQFNAIEPADLKMSNSPKVIFNQVLENPWNPRKPINYRPFRRKDERLDSLNLEIVKKNHISLPLHNDNNNNIELIRSPAETVMGGLAERVSFVAIDPTDLGSSSCVDQDVLKCIHCDQVFTSGDALAVHMRRHSSSARYTCTECGKTFSQLRNYKYHMSIHRGTKEFAATCTVCGKYFNDRGYLSSHMKIHRNRKEYKCSLCPKSFNQRVAYNMHVRIHTGVKPHVCSECGKAFSRKMLLKQHQRTHSGERPYACVHCDKRFADRSNMTLHLRLHTGVKPFSCSLCPKSFTKKHHLKSHLNFHTGSKPYSCPRCKLAFTQSSNMRTHYKKCNAPDSSGNDSQTK